MKLLTTRQVAKLLHITQRRVRDLIDEGKIPAIKIGVQYLIEEESLADVKVYGKPGRPKGEKKGIAA